MLNVNITELIQEIIFYSVINSFVVFGILQTIKRILETETLNRFVGLGITYGIGVLMGFMLQFQVPTWQKIMFGVFIGSCSVSVYKSATQSLLDLIPAVVERFLKPTAVEPKPNQYDDTPKV